MRKNKNYVPLEPLPTPLKTFVKGDRLRHNNIIYEVILVTTNPSSYSIVALQPERGLSIIRYQTEIQHWERIP